MMETAGILIAAIGWLVTIILTIIVQTIILFKYIDKKAHDRNLQENKNKLDEKLHVTKTRFDAEFAIYRELSRTFFDAVLASTSLFPLGTALVSADKEIKKKQERENYVMANAANLKAQNALYENTPFISEILDTQFKELLELCRRQVSLFETRYSVGMQDYSTKHQSEGFKRSEDILQKWDSICKSMRDYLSTLDVVE